MAERRPSPLDILVQTMLRKWDADDWDGAVALAKVAAPYIHPRAAVSRMPRNIADVEDEDLHEFCERAGAEGDLAAGESKD